MHATRGDSFIAVIHIEFDGPLESGLCPSAAFTAIKNFPTSRNRLNWLTDFFSTGLEVRATSQRGRAVFPGISVINYFESVGNLKDIWGRPIHDFSVGIDTI